MMTGTDLLLLTSRSCSIHIFRSSFLLSVTHLSWSRVRDGFNDSQCDRGGGPLKDGLQLPTTIVGEICRRRGRHHWTWAFAVISINSEQRLPVHYGTREIERPIASERPDPPTWQWRIFNKHLPKKTVDMDCILIFDSNHPAAHNIANLTAVFSHITPLYSIPESKKYKEYRQYDVFRANRYATILYEDAPKRAPHSNNVII